MPKGHFILYDSNEKNFTSMGVLVLDHYIMNTCIKETMNENYTFEFEMFNSVAHLVGPRMYIKAPTRKGEELFRVRIIEKDMNNYGATYFYCTQVFFCDMEDNFIENLELLNVTGYAALNFMDTNTQYPHKFNFYSDISESNSTIILRKNFVSALIGDSEYSFVNTWGGELEVNKFDVKMMTKIGQDRGVRIRYRKNLTGLNAKTDYSSYCTRIMPIGYDNITIPEKYVDSEKIDPNHPIIRVIEFSNIKVKYNEEDEEGYATIEEAENALRDAARKLFTEGKIDEPESTYEIEFQELAETIEYHDEYAVLENIFLGDTVEVYHEALDISISTRCVSYEYDPQTDRYNSITLGNAISKFTSSSIKNQETIIDKIESSNKDYQGKLDDAIEKLTNMINTGLTGHVVITENEIMIMDTTDKETAVEVWRYNINGFGYSNTGYNGPFVGLTKDGKLLVTEATTNKFTAALINAGVLQSIDKSSWFNLDNGTFSWANGAIAYDGNKLTIKVGDQSIDDILDTRFNVLVNHEHQIIQLDSNYYPIDNGSYEFTFTVLKENSTVETPCLVTGVTPHVSVEGISFKMKDNKCTMVVDKTKRLLDVKEDFFDVTLEVLDYTLTKRLTWSVSVNGRDGNAKLIKINASTNVFKSTDGGVTFAPSSISLTSAVQNVSFSKWQYSSNGSSFTNVTSGEHGLTVNGSTLVVSATSDLFTDTVTTLAIRVVSSTSTVYDTMTLYKLYDRTDINDKFEQMTLTVTQSNEKWEAAFKNSNANNMFLNSDAKTGDTTNWISNGGGISIAKANVFPFYGSTENYFKTSFPNGMRYEHDIQLEPNTDYVYEGYIYVNSPVTGDDNSPLNFWVWKGTTPTSTRLCTVIDYRQTLTSGRFVKCYVHFKTDNVTEALYGRFFIYNTGTVSHVGVKRLSLKKGTVESTWTQHPNEVKSIVTSIDQDGVKVKHSEVGTYTQMDATGFSIRDSATGDVFAWLSSKEQWTELKVDKVFAGNVENVYEGDSNLYVNHAATVAGDGSADKPFNSFKQLSEYLQATPVINKDLYITVRDPGFVIHEQLRLDRLKGAGYIKITLEGTLVIANAGTVNGNGDYCIRLHQISKWVLITSGREFGSSTTGAVLQDGGSGGGHGIYATDVDRLQVDSLTISCKNWGIVTERVHLYTGHLDFGKCYNAVELGYQSIYHSSNDVGSCVDFCRITGGSLACWGTGSVRPQGNVLESGGLYYDHGKSLTPTASTRYPSSNPSAPSGQQTYTYTYNWTSHKTYQYKWSNWNDSDCKQGSWGYGLRGGHMFFDLSTIRSQMTGTIQDGNTITLTRANSGGNSGQSNVYINGSTCSSASGTPSYGGQTLLGTLAWGETKTFTLPKAIVQGLISGSYNSLAVYVNSTASNCYINIVNAKITLKTKK